jgi:hypothetical protein
MPVNPLGFEFPLLGPTGEGDIAYPPGYDALDESVPNRPVYWWVPEHRSYYVLYQLDRPAVAFRCYYPGGSAPCDKETADRFIDWVKEHDVPAGEGPDG